METIDCTEMFEVGEPRDLNAVYRVFRRIPYPLGLKETIHLSTEGNEHRHILLMILNASGWRLSVVKLWFGVSTSELNAITSGLVPMTSQQKEKALLIGDLYNQAHRTLWRYEQLNRWLNEPKSNLRSGTNADYLSTISGIKYASIQLKSL